MCTATVDQFRDVVIRPPGTSASHPRSFFSSNGMPSQRADKMDHKVYEKLPQTQASLNHILHHYLNFRQSASLNDAPKPFFVGLSGCQGSGKTTLCRTLAHLLSQPPHNLRVVTFSMDDLYLPFSTQQALAQSNPGNRLIEFRGQPGTHDVALGVQIFQQFSTAHAAYFDTTDQAPQVSIPSYDKSLNSGRGDRLPQSNWPTVTPPFDIVLFEGWSLGFKPLPASEVERRHEALRRLGAYPLEHLQLVNTELAKYERDWYPVLDAFVHIAPLDLEDVYRWRLQQEHVMRRDRGVQGLTDEQVRDFVDRYMPAYDLYLSRLERVGFFGSGYLGEEQKAYEREGGTPKYNAPGKHLKIVIDGERKVVVSQVTDGDGKWKDFDVSKKSVVRGWKHTTLREWHNRKLEWIGGVLTAGVVAWMVVRQREKWGGRVMGVVEMVKGLWRREQA